MRSIDDLKDALTGAYHKRLIHNVEFHSLFIDIDFSLRDEPTRLKMMQLRDYILASYKEVRGAEYLPIMNRLRLYVCR